MDMYYPLCPPMMRAVSNCSPSRLAPQSNTATYRLSRRTPAQNPPRNLAPDRRGKGGGGSPLAIREEEEEER
uniref:Uncharacterized protein n=1 Tax=Oryza glumipatula TaxID=40148 RepID=A0A0D9Z395_9ORYZ